MKRTGMVLFVAIVLAVTLGARPSSQNKNGNGHAFGHDDDDDGGTLVLRAFLRGAEEPPAISTGARGTFKAELDDTGTMLEYELSYTGLEGDILQAHIHLGQKGVNGGIAAFLCTNLGNGPGGTPACPGPHEGTVTGTILAASVVGPSGQGLAAGEFEEFLRAIDKNLTYANVHSSLFTSGEIRGQISVRREDDNDD